MPALTATRLPDTDTQVGLVPGIGAHEADLIANAARHFLDHAADGSHPVTMAVITYQIGTLFTPYTPATIGKYECGMPDKTHWCV